ncbi:MAG: prepilin-type N-terminal cleavage/methylation domain-containing protein [Moraxella sp.]|nr:prepilin-type N-terminal cleavage/methylation domain-containing protein [Moraxella sp.]
MPINHSKPTIAYRGQKGFTLIELMIVVIIISVLAAIALPSYQFVVIRNGEAQAQSTMGQLQIELDRWRATALTYRGFVPISGVNAAGNPTYGFGNADNTIIYIPTGSTAADYRYQIQLLDGGTNTTLSPTGNNAMNVAAGRSWVMVATPNNTGSLKNASAFVVRSTGFRCKTARGVAADKISNTTTACTAAGLETW